MDLKSTTRSHRQSRGDPSRSTMTIHRCYTSPCDSRSDLGTTSEVVFTNNSPLLPSSALVDDSPPLPSAAFTDSLRRHLSPTSLTVDSSSPLGDDSPPLPSAAFADIFHRRPSLSTRRHRSAAFADIVRRRLSPSTRRHRSAAFTDILRRCPSPLSRRHYSAALTDIPCRRRAASELPASPTR